MKALKYVAAGILFLVGTNAAAECARVNQLMPAGGSSTTTQLNGNLDNGLTVNARNAPEIAVLQAAFVADKQLCYTIVRTGTKTYVISGLNVSR
ncbi:MAG: hypothetical protein JNL01_06380 [Bdellovibrionales bacterium]|nr:hypothetical protein [Bdellovibrionales bacterium]